MLDATYSTLTAFSDDNQNNDINNMFGCSGCCYYFIMSVAHKRGRFARENFIFFLSLILDADLSCIYIYDNVVSHAQNAHNKLMNERKNVV